MKTIANMRRRCSRKYLVSKL